MSWKRCWNSPGVHGYYDTEDDHEYQFVPDDNNSSFYLTASGEASSSARGGGIDTAHYHHHHHRSGSGSSASSNRNFPSSINSSTRQLADPFANGVSQNDGSTASSGGMFRASRQQHNNNFRSDRSRGGHVSPFGGGGIHDHHHHHRNQTADNLHNHYRVFGLKTSPNSSNNNTTSASTTSSQWSRTPPNASPNYYASNDTRHPLELNDFWEEKYARIVFTTNGTAGLPVGPMAHKY